MALLALGPAGRSDGQETGSPDRTEQSKAGRFSLLSGVPNYLAKFSGPDTLESSSLYESGARLGFGTQSPLATLHVVGNLLLADQETHQVEVSGHASSARFGQDLLGAFVASDTLGASIRFLTNNGNDLVERLTLTAGGKLSVTGSPALDGELVITPATQDAVPAFPPQSGSQMRLRLSRAACDFSDVANSPGCDLSNLGARDLLITPYAYGMQIEYPSVIEVWSRDFSIHNNTRDCPLADSTCNDGARLWVGNQTDTGGLFATAHDGGTARESYALIAADRFDHTSHGSLRLQVRDPADSFVFEAGAYGAEQRVARIDASGKGYFNGGTQTGGADFAEAIEAAGDPSTYSPGDVLVIDPLSSRRVTLSRESYAANVAGVYSTRPGVLAGRYGMDDPRLSVEIPMAVLGIVPCKVSAENGSIRPGDLLVTASRPGHAMKGTEPGRMMGAVIGKALEPLAAGMGVIEILVSLQ